MAYYRLYFIDPRNGHIAACEEIAADGDAEACAAAERHRGWQPLELWCGGNKVRSFEAEAAASREAVDEMVARLD